MTAAEPFDLERFVAAQDLVFATVRGELQGGRKHTHWMWFVFPQIAGLGSSPMARKYAISSRAEAEAYLRHLVLGPRLEDCTRLVLAVEGRTITEIFGRPDDLKFHSSMTLFAQAAPAGGIFAEALQKFFAGQPDRATLQRLGARTA